MREREREVSESGSDGEESGNDDEVENQKEIAHFLTNSEKEEEEEEEEEKGEEEVEGSLPSRKRQREIIKSLKECLTMKEGDKWYLVGQSWWNHWKHYTKVFFFSFLFFSFSLKSK